MLLTAHIDSHSAEADDSDGSPRSRIDRLLNDVHPSLSVGVHSQSHAELSKQFRAIQAPKELLPELRHFSFAQSASACRNLAHLQAGTRSPGAVSLRGVPGGSEWRMELARTGSLYQ